MSYLYEDEDQENVQEEVMLNLSMCQTTCRLGWAWGGHWRQLTNYVESLGKWSFNTVAWMETCILLNSNRKYIDILLLCI